MRQLLCTFNQATRQQVDDHTPEKALPRCTLSAEYFSESNEEMKTVQHQVHGADWSRGSI